MSKEQGGSRTDPWKSFLSQHVHWIKTHPKAKRSWNIRLQKQAVLLAPTTQYLGIQPRRIYGFFFQALLSFFYLIMSGEEHFPVSISSLIHFRSAKERSGHSSPHKDNRGWDNSLLVNLELKQPEACAPRLLSPACPEQSALQYQTNMTTPSTPPGLGVLLLLSPSGVFLKMQSHAAFHEFKGDRVCTTLCASAYI